MKGRDNMRSIGIATALIFLVGALIGQAASAQMTWTGPGLLNTNATTDSGWDSTPRLATDGSGNWIAVWEYQEDPMADWDVLVACSSDNGASWTAPALLNTNAATDSGSDHYPEIAADGSGNWVAVWGSGEDLSGAGADSDIFVARSTDNGATWTAPALLNTNATTDSGSDGGPYVATDGSGNWVTVWESLEDLSGAGADADIFVARSTDNGATWTAPALLNTNATTDSGLDGTQELATDGSGNWVAVWQSTENLSGAGTDKDIFIARSTDNGATWTAPALLNTNATADSRLDRAPDIATDGSGNWSAVWYSRENLSGAGTDSDIFIARSTDNGASWTAPSLLNTNATTDSGNDEAPQIATDGLGNWLAVWESFEDLSGAGMDFDIFVARSTDNGASWAAPGLLNANAATDSWAGDVLPSMATDGSGNWVVVWNSSGSLSGAGTDYDIFVATWETIESQVSSASPQSSTTVRVVFDEDMTNDAALVTAGNYTFTGTVALTAAAVTRVDATTVDVTVNEMTHGASYTVAVDTSASGPTDLAGNHVDAAANSAAFTGVGTAPTISIDSVSPALAKDGDTVTVDVTATDDVGISGIPSVTLNSGAVAHQGTVGSTYTYTLVLPGGSTEGAATIAASASDAAGNPGSGADTTSLSIDNTAPSAPTVSGSALTNSATPTWTWSSSGGGNGTFRLAVDAESGWTETVASAYTPGTALSEGAHTLYVQERDAVDNWSASGSFVTTIDLTAPQIAIGAPTPATTSGDPVTYGVTYTGADTITLADGDVSLLTTGDASADATVSAGAGPDERTITLANFTGTGDITPRIAAGTATDLAGNATAQTDATQAVTVSGGSEVPLHRGVAAILMACIALTVMWRFGGREKSAVVPDV
ncbi:MAG: exo-alpha-sialidase [bacterium]|nr:exo-alpha-sialidase [bacterium]